MTRTAFLITRPDAHSGKSARRAGAPNHLQGSGENPMVGNKAVSADLATLVDAIRATITDPAKRPARWTDFGDKLGTDFHALADVVIELVTEYADRVMAERDALAEDLAWELNATRDVGRDDTTTRLFESGEAFLAWMDELCADLEGGPR
jgi:hypothetical protein